MNLKLFFLAFFISLLWWGGVNYFQGNLENVFYAQISQPMEEAVFVNFPQEPATPELNLQAKAALAIRVNKKGSKKSLFSQNASQPLPIASLTKLMTALVVFENTAEQDYNFSNLVTVSETAAAKEDVPVFGNLKKGDKLLLERVLELMLIYSSNDAAAALSEIIGEENFVDRMNQKAQSLGLENTHFVNPTGLDPKDIHYEENNIEYFNHSTVEDLIKLAQYILKGYPKIFEISLSQGPYPVENGTSDLIIPEKFKFLGGKTGYTDEAGGCMLLVLENEKGSELINVILGAPSPEIRITEAQKIIDYQARL